MSAVRIWLMSCVVLGCTLDPRPEPKDDQLDQHATVEIEGDGGGVDIERSLPSPTAPDTPTTHECHDPCPLQCGIDAACCHSTSQCVSLDCPECCPDADFGRDELAFGGR
jgi:hypothetical protein